MANNVTAIATATTTAAEAPVAKKSNDLMPRYAYNIDYTTDLLNKKTSENCLVSMVEHVAYKTAAAGMFVLEVLKNLFFVAYNSVAWVVNGFHNYFSDKEVEEVQAETKIEEEDVTLQKAPENEATWGDLVYWATGIIRVPAYFFYSHVLSPCMGRFMGQKQATAPVVTPTPDAQATKV